MTATYVSPIEHSDKYVAQIHLFTREDGMVYWECEPPTTAASHDVFVDIMNWFEAFVAQRAQASADGTLTTLDRSDYANH